MALALWFRAAIGHALLKLCLALDRHELTQLHHSSQQTMQIQNRTHAASLHCNQHSCVLLGTSLDRRAERNGVHPNSCLREACIQLPFCWSYSPPSSPAGFPFSCAHDFGPPGTEFVLWKKNKVKTKPKQTNKNVQRSVNYSSFPG